MPSLAPHVVKVCHRSLRQTHLLLPAFAEREESYNDFYRGGKIPSAFRAGCLLGTFADSFLEILIKMKLS